MQRAEALAIFRHLFERVLKAHGFTRRDFLHASHKSWHKRSIMVSFITAGTHYGGSNSELAIVSGMSKGSVSRYRTSYLLKGKAKR